MFKLLMVALIALAYVAFVAIIHTPAFLAHPALGALLLGLILLAVFLSVLKAEPRRRLLRWALTGMGLVALAACTSGCSGLGGLGLPGGTDQTAILNAVNAHIEGCERHYHGQTVPPSLSVQIDCPARPGAAPLTVGTTVAAPTTLPQ